jgi:uncharacterized protein (TIGR00369 family)
VETIRRPETAEEWTQAGVPFLPGYLGIEILSAASDELTGRLAVTTRHHAPNGFLHAGTVITLADTLCGYGTVMNLPAGAVGFATIELKSNFLGTALDGELIGTAKPLHLGRTTQVWDAVVRSDAQDKTIALFRCTQSVLWPKS